MLDPGSQLNLLSITIVKEQNLHVERLPRLVAEWVNGGKLTIYSVTTVDTYIVDARGRKEMHQVPFIVTDLSRYKIYLGMP